MTIKTQQLALRLMALCFLFLIQGCTGSGGSHGGSYTLQFNWTNTSSVNVRMAAKDRGFKGGTTDLVDVLAGNAPQSSVLSNVYREPTTDIGVTIYSLSGAILGDGTVTGVHVGEDKTTYIYVTYNGSKTTLDATRLPGVH